MEIDGRAMMVWLLYPTWASARGFLGHFAWSNSARLLLNFDGRMNPSLPNVVRPDAHSQPERDRYAAR